MNKRPIIFSAPMIRAILDGRKTQTRRVIKPQPTVNKFGTILWTQGRADSQIAAACPYGYCQPGPTGIHPRLWVRETWIPVHHGSYEVFDRKIGFGDRTAIVYAADPGVGYHEVWDNYKGKWRPSIFMPRWASRITLEITEIRVQRAQEISGEDIKAEGIEGDYYPDVEATDPHSAAIYYMELWDSLNSKRGYGWDKNPWVWAITFRRIAP